MKLYIIKHKSRYNALSVIIIFLFFIANLSSQELCNFSGIVKDENHDKLDLALIALHSLSDSNYIKSGYSDQDGSFVINNVQYGTYKLSVNMLGYQTYQDTITFDKASKSQFPLTIVLKNAINLIDEITITASTPFIERKIDRTIVNLDAISTNEGSDILEVLERAPGISLDNNGSILLKGRSGVSIFINDKPAYLSGTALESYLRSLPAGTVKRIEIMTNPPAKYEAAGNSGVINIIMKKNTLKGINGNISLSIRKGKYTSSNNSLNLNYNMESIGFYVNSYGGFFNSFQDLNINRYYKNEENLYLSSFTQNSYNQNNGNYKSTTIGTDYFISDNTSIGFSFRISDNPSNSYVDNISKVSDAMNALTQTVVADNNTNRSFTNTVYNTYISHGLDSLGSSINFDVDYVKYSSGSDQVFKNLLYDPNNVLNFEDQINGDIPSTISIFAAKSDYTKIFKDGSRFESGAKLAFTKTDNEAKYSTVIDEVETPNYQLSNRFLYDEWINAAYLNYSRTFGRIGLQMGLRLESTKLTGEQLGNISNPDTSFTRRYTNLFPTFYASWQMDSNANNTLVFSYGRRINRPIFQDLNPFISPLDKFTFYSGNPDLLPTYSNNLSLSHSFKSLFSTTINYSKTLDGINETLEIRDGIYYSRPGNIANSQTLSISLETTIPIKKWYTFNSYFELSHLSFNSPLYSEQLNSSGTYHYLSATNNFRIGKGWSFNFTGLYRSDLVYAQLLLKSYGQLNLSVQKRLLNNSATIALTVDDILYTRRGDGIIYNLTLTDADWNSTFDSRRGTLTFSWRFGENTFKKKKHRGNGSTDEQNRVRS